MGKLPIALGMSACFVVGAHAAETPKSGEDAYTSSFVVVATNTMKSGDKNVVYLELNGITTNDAGGQMFNNVGTRCMGLREMTGSAVHSRGSCVDVDTDGDQFYSDFDADAKGGVHTFTGGTGKYKGLTGSAPYTYTNLKGPEGANRMFIVRHKAKWQLPNS
ncbi:hypothetical protein [Bradyrhizobium sp. P5_C11_2]